MFELSQRPLSDRDRRVRSVIMGLCCTPVLGSYFYNQGYRVPFLVCPIRHWTGIPCPSCGLTRSFMAVARGDWTQAFTQHLFGPFLFAIFLIGAIHLALELLIGYRVTAFYEKVLRERKLQWIFLLRVLIYYGLRLYYLLKSGKLSLAFERSPLGQWFTSRTNTL